MTPIPNDGAIVDYTDYYAGLIAVQRLLTDNPVEPGGPPISLLTAPVVISGTPVAGKIPKAISATQATWQDDTGGTTDPVTPTTNGLMIASDKVLVNDRIPRVYAGRAGSFGLAGNGTTDDRAALDALLNTTIPAAGGVFTPDPGTILRIVSSLVSPASLTSPAKALWRFRKGAMLKLDPGAVVTMSSLPEAGLYQIFDQSAGHPVSSPCDVLMPGHEIPIEWFGGARDGNDIYKPLLNALRSLRGSGAGGTLRLPLRGDTPYSLNTPVVVSGDFFSKARIVGPGRIKHTSVVPEVSQIMLMFFQTAGSGATLETWDPEVHGIRGLELRDLKISGAGVGDYTLLVGLSGCSDVKVIDCEWSDTEREGIASFNASNCKGLSFVNCKATRVGRASTVSAYNVNSDDGRIVNCSAKDVGTFTEQGGQDFISCGNLVDGFNFFGEQLHSSTYASERANSYGSIFKHGSGATAGPAFSLSDATSGLGAGLFSNHIVFDCKKGGVLGSALNRGGIVQGCYFYGGSNEGSALQSGPGRHTFKNNVIEQVKGTTTGTTQAGSNRMVCPIDCGLTRGWMCTIAGVSGGPRKVIKHVYDNDFNRMIVWLDVASAEAVTGAAVAYYTEKWGYGIQVSTDELEHICGNHFFGECWTGAAIRIRSVKQSVYNNYFDPRDDTYTSVMPVLQIWNGVDVCGKLTSLDFDPRRPWSYGRMCGSFIHASAAPPELTWHVGDKVHYTAPTAGGNIGLVCTTSGTAGTLNSGATTATIASAVSRSATLNSVAGLYHGAKFTIATMAGARTVDTIAGNVVTWPSTEATAGVTGSGLAVAYSAPTWKTWGPIAA